MATAAERSPNVVWQRTHVDRAARAARGWCGAVVWLTGLPSSGKSTIAARVEELLVAKGRPAYLLDGDNLRHGLCGDLGFSAADRSENIRRAAHVAALLADAGVVALVALVSPFRADRERARAIAAEAAVPFAEVYVATPPEECERRDPKGLWRRARNGEIQGFTGVDDPYEPPTEPDLLLTPQFAANEAAQRVLELIERISPTARPTHAGS